VGGQHVAEELLAETAVAVDRSGVDEVDPGVEGGVEHALLVLDVTPPVAGEGPHSEAHFGDFEVGLAESAVAHTCLPGRRSFEDTLDGPG